MQPAAKHPPAAPGSWDDPLPLWAPRTGAGRETLWVAAVSGLLGIVAGLGLAQWQVAVESAQVVAGEVVYPYATSFHTYHLKGWTLLHQVPALLLSAGMSAEVASQLLAAFSGMLGFQALALIALAVGANRWLALTAPVLYQGYAVLWGLVCAVYPLQFLDTPNTYGTLTPSFVLLAWALLGLGHLRTGWFLLALSPAIHVTLGAWGLLAAAIATLLTGQMRPTFRAVWPSLVAAVVLIGLSLAWQTTFWRQMPEISAADTAKYLAVSQQLRDTHRPIVPPFHQAAVLNLLLVALAALLCTRLASDVPSASSALLATLAASGSLAVVACWLTPWQDNLPQAFVRAMPGRYVNLGILAFPGVLVGLVGSQWSRLSVRAAWVWPWIALLVGTLGPRNSTVWTMFVGSAVVVLLIRLVRPQRLGLLCEAFILLSALFLVGQRWSGWGAAAAVAALAAVELLAMRFAWTVSTRNVAWAVSLLGFLVAGGWGMTHARHLAERRMRPDSALRSAAQNAGMLATGSDLFLVQVQTGRPVLFCGNALDMLPYSPESGPDAHRVLAEVYGIDLFNPQPDTSEIYGNRLGASAGHELWQSRSTADWQALAQKFRFTDVLVYKDWTLDLPLLADGEKLRLYRIPSPTP